MQPGPRIFIDTALVIMDSSLAVPQETYAPYDPTVGVQPYGNAIEGISLRMITGQTTRVLNKGVLEFCVQHRFGFISGGKDQFYGFDVSDVRLGFDYGLTRKITLGVGRSSMGKAFNGFVKAAIVKQGEHSMFNFSWLSDMYISGLKNNDASLDPYYFTHRLKFTNQLLISHSFGQRFMLSVAPTVVHRNLVDSAKYANDLSLLIVNGRLKIREGLNLTGEYSYLFNHNMRKLYTPCISAGVELYTSGHIFQIVFTNSNSMNEADAYAMQNGKWSKGNIRMGFNIVRQF